MKLINLWVLAVSILAGSAFAQEREMILPVSQSAYSQGVKIKVLQGIEWQRVER
jgi:hypothetical protein